MNVEKIISQLESKETLLIFLRNNFPNVLDERNNSRGLNQSPTADADDSNHQSDLNGNYTDK